MPSEQMKWSELRERMAELLDLFFCPPRDKHALLAAQSLFADIDAAAPAMERQERAIMALRALGKTLFESDDIEERTLARDSVAALAKVFFKTEAATAAEKERV